MRKHHPTTSDETTAPNPVTEPTTTMDTDAPATTDRFTTQQPVVADSSSGGRRLLGAMFGFLVVVQPVAAQTTAVCGADKLPGMIEGFFQLSIGLGLVGLVVVWQADSLIEMFTMDAAQKKTLKRHKLAALKSGVVLLALGPLYTVAGTTMGLPLAECVDLVPW